LSGRSTGKLSYAAHDLVSFAIRSTAEDVEWSDGNIKLINRVLETVVESNAELEIRTHH